MTIVAPWGVWQCSDHRVNWIKGRKVVRNEDDSFKHIQVSCSDGVALITYSGLGAIDNDIYLSDWTRRQLRGETLSVDQSLIRIREQATAKFGRRAAGAGVSHGFLVGAFIQGHPWLVAIWNMQWPPGSPLLDHFRTEALSAKDEPRLVVFGQAGDAISKDDQALLKRVTQRRPKRPEDYSQVLADVHRRAKHSKHPARDTISEQCTTTFMPPSGEGLQTKIHWTPPGKLLFPLVPQLLYGVDFTELAEVQAREFYARKADQPLDEAEISRLLDEAGRRSTERPPP
jgi:hypothetical protein